MRIFTEIPVEVENTIWEYYCLFKLRNGILIPQIKIPIKIIEHFKNTQIKVHFTQSKLIMCIGMTKTINKNVHSIMLEVNRVLYLKKNTIEKNEHFYLIQDLVSNWLNMIYSL
jgi:hypothetical protein